MAKVDEGFTIKLPKKGSNKMLLPVFAVLAFLFVSIAFGMYIYEPTKSNTANVNQVATLAEDAQKISLSQPSNTLVEKVDQEKNIMAKKNITNNSGVENKNIGQNNIPINPVQEFQQVLNFDFDSTEIKVYDDQALQKFLADNKNKNLKIIIDGHTDSIGSEDYNQALSERRANSAEQEINKMTGSLQNNVTKKITGYGETKPVDTNDSSEGRAHNRRVEITIIVLN